MRPPDRTHHLGHRRRANSFSTRLFPGLFLRLDTIDETNIRLLFGVLAEPIEVDFPWVVSTHGSALDVPRFSTTPKESTDRRPSNAENLRSFLVGLRESQCVGREDSLTESERDHLHFRSEFSDLFKARAV